MSNPVEVTIGVVGRAHGIKGEVTIEVRTDEVDRRFVAGAQLTTDTGRQLEIAGVRRASGRLLVAFKQVADRTSAEQLRGAQLLARVPSDELPSGSDEYFDRQLIGLQVLDAAGDQVGQIIEVVHGPAQDLLVIDLGADQRLVPFVSQLVPEVDLQGGWVRLADVGGLLADEEDD